MKKVITIILLLIVSIGVFGQEKNEQKGQTSKMQDFTSKTGVIIKFEDYNLPNIKAMFYTLVESRVRKIMSGNEEQFFFQIDKKVKYGSKTASIAYEDLLEVQKALIKLKSQSEIDLSTTSNYLQNQFITEDGFKVGYYLDKGKIAWSIRLEEYGSDNSIFIKNFETLEKAFELGKEKIEELKLK